MPVVIPTTIHEVTESHAVGVVHRKPSPGAKSTLEQTSDVSIDGAVVATIGRFGPGEEKDYEVWIGSGFEVSTDSWFKALTFALTRGLGK